MINFKYIFRIYQIIRTRILFGTQLKHLGKSVILSSPLRVDKKKFISIDDYTYIGYYAWLGATPSTGADICNLSIGANCAIGNFNHIYATESIIIEDNVLTADKVYISDNIHAYNDILKPIKDQKILQKKHVVIGSGSWIGECTSIIGASIGKHSVIGANSVVTHDIPPFSVAVGSPAKVIKRYNKETKQWERI